MIPKIIHYCWLSGDPMPESMQRYLRTWRRHMPGYEFWLWDFSRFPKDKCEWVSEAFDQKKYAFAADYIRCYALYNYGGIYFDCDVEVRRPFDDLLSLPYAFGFENGSGCIEAAVMVSEPGNPIFKKMLDYYAETKHFAMPDGKLNTKPLPRLIRDVAIPPRQVLPIDSPVDFVRDDNVVCVLPYTYFSPIHIEHREEQSEPSTYAVHHFDGSWVTGFDRWRKKIKLLIGPKLTRIGIKLKRFFFGKRRD